MYLFCSYFLNENIKVICFINKLCENFLYVCRFILYVYVLCCVVGDINYLGWCLKIKIILRCIELVWCLRVFLINRNSCLKLWYCLYLYVILINRLKLLFCILINWIIWKIVFKGSWMNILYNFKLRVKI